MKKYITAPIGSAFIIPGFGQILNGDIKKGITLLGVVFVIFLAAVIKLTQIITQLLPELNPDEINSEEILARIDSMDITLIKVLVFIFLAVWLYSVIDAIIYGIKVEKERK
jgi:archaellum biogenesis protein FlaJ (TadC family)